VIRIVIGSIVAGLIQFIIGAIAWVSPLGKLAFAALADPQTAEVQAALAKSLSPTGTGTYFIPSPETAAGTQMLGHGPVALVHFNSNGFPAAMNPTALIAGLAMSMIMMMLVGVAVSRLPDFASRLRTVMLFAVAMVMYFVFTLPIYNFYMPWAWWIFLGIQEFVAFAAGAFVLVRWFMPRAAAGAIMPETAPHS
jgi:hypothetical protein